jgi:hypothetical protein
MSTTTASSAAFVSLTLGRSANAIELSVPPAPAVSAAGDLKARSFDFLADLLTSHSGLYSSAELFTAFSGHIPTSAYNATLEANNICNDIRSSVFHVANLIPLGFRDHLGKVINTAITADISKRPSGICYFAFRSTTQPSAHDSRLSVPSHSFEFWLALPQSILGSTPPAVGAADTVRKHLTFDTPNKTSASTTAFTVPLITLADLEAMPATTRAALGTSTSTDTMTDYDPACFSLLLPSQIKCLVIRSADAATAAAASLSVMSPRMSAVLASTATSNSSYFGTLDFLDSQSAFEAVFPDPVPLLVTPTTAGAVSVDSTALLVKLLAFIDRCKFQLFVPIFRCDYVGTADRDDAASLHATIQALKRPSMSYRHHSSGQWVNLTPDELFSEYAELTPLLPDNVSLWGLNLVTQFLDALSLDLQEALQTDPLYFTPNLSTLTSRSSQLGALRSLRVAAVRQHTLLRAQERLIAKTVNRKLNKQSPGTTALAAPTSASIPRLSFGSNAPSVVPTDDVSALTRSFMSPAEQTMSRYQPTPTITSTAGPHSSNPIDPVTNFQSSYPAGFLGCMCCGDPNHVYRACSQNGQPGASAVFYKNLFAHKPHLRQRDPRPDEMLPARPTTQSFAAPAGSIPPAQPSAAGLPSSIRLPPPNSSAETNSVLTSGSAIPPQPLLPPATSPPKRARFFVQLVKSFQANLPAPAPPLPPMPIAIDNGLPHITFNLGSNPEQDPTICGLMDTCGALNTGYLPFHLWMKSVRPDIVAEFVSFDDSNPFEPIKLGGAIQDPSGFVSDDHGNLTAVIRYYTPYTDTAGSPITLSFALGSDVTVNTIFGLPMLCDLDAVISLRSNSMHSRSLNCDFPITRNAAKFGLPAGCSFDPAAASRNHASTLNLTPSAAAFASASAAVLSNNSTLATATDDTSLGFLQRTVHPSA